MLNLAPYELTEAVEVLAERLNGFGTSILFKNGLPLLSFIDGFSRD